MSIKELLERHKRDVALRKAMFETPEDYPEARIREVLTDSCEIELWSYDVPVDVWNSIESINELLAILIERREDLVGGGIRERLLYE